MRTIIAISCLFAFVLSTSAQNCTAPGQTPESAILVCGDANLTVTTASFCGTRNIPVPCSDNYPYRNTNPNFFRMACYRSGTLGFSIMPNDLNTNFSWQLFDITSTNPIDIFTNPGLFVACNWSGDLGETGASSNGTDLMVCSGANQPLFSKMPDIVAGRTYLLMVVNESSSTSPYQLTFGGGTASITDAFEPHMVTAGMSCDGTHVWVRLNKQMQCGTIASDGSDFSLNVGTITAAYPGNYAPILGSDSVYLVLDRPLANGNYTLTIHNGSDGNTLTDICQRNIPEQEFVNFSITSLQPTPMDSIKPAGCTPGYIELVFKKPIRCSSVASDGSDFIISGPSPASVMPTGCPAGANKSILRLSFTSAVVGGNYQIKLVTGSDGNTIMDECGLPTPGGATLPFEIKEFVSAQFTYTIPPSCNEVSVSFFHDGAHNVNSWNWDFGNGRTSAVQNPVTLFTKPGVQPVRLIVTNGTCSDTVSKSISIGGFLKASFDAPKMLCPGDSLQLANNSTGNIDYWKWDFGNGISSFAKDPVGHRYSSIGRDVFYTIRLTARNTVLDCGDSMKRVIKILSNCSINVPSAFSPNADGLNDYLYPLNALKADNLQFQVYNRLGQLVFSTADWTRKWDGTFKGVPQPPGVYAWLLSYKEHDTGEHRFFKGTTMLIR